VKHIEGMHFQGESSSNAVVAMDASATAGGTGKGATPLELILMALAGCSGMDIISILGKMRIAYDRLVIEVEGEVTSDHPKVFTDIEVIYKFWGEDLPRDRIEHAIHLSFSKYCSVANMLDRAANVTYSLEINPPE